jgi:ribosomal protein S18 acetylase RimI-like enzyme
VTESTQPRRITDADAPDVLELITLCEIAETGEALCTLDELLADFADEGSRGIALDRPDGGIEAYAWASPRRALGLVMGEICVRPGGDWSVAAVLVRWLRRAAVEIGGSVPLHCFARVVNPAMCRLYVSEGGRVVRRYYRMEIELSDALAPPPPLPGVEVRAVADDDDLRAMYSVIEAAFADHFAHEPQTFEEWRRKSVGGGCADLGLWWLATVDGVPVAGIYGFTGSGGGFVDMLGTLSEFRGRGLGSLLLGTAFAEFGRRGHRKAGLNVDVANGSGALALYEGLGMTVAYEDLRYELPALPPFVPLGFQPALHCTIAGFRLEPLGPEHNDSDHAAWMSSIEHIRSLPGYPDGQWPREMSLADNRSDLERHSRDFLECRGFTYTVLDSSGTVAGCLYIHPAKDGVHDAAVQSWLRKSEEEREAPFRQAVTDWLLTDAWPFDRPLYEPHLG